MSKDNGAAPFADALYLRLTAEESAALAAASSDLGMSRQEFLRGLIRNWFGTPDGVPALVGSKEAAEILGGLTRQQMHSRSRKPGFPAPVEWLAAGPVWRRTDIEGLVARDVG